MNLQNPFKRRTQSWMQRDCKVVACYHSLLLFSFVVLSEPWKHSWKFVCRPNISTCRGEAWKVQPLEGLMEGAVSLMK
jgi:hypothetical protein